MPSRSRDCTICQSPVHKSPFCPATRAREEYRAKRKPQSEKFCKNCHAPIEKERARRQGKFCGPVCVRAARRRNYIDWNLRQDPSAHLPTGTVGTVGELMIALDLLRKGYAVFRALSPAASCDLAVLANGQLVRVEVATAHYNASGSPIIPRKDNKKFDVLGLAMIDGTVTYIPKGFWTNLEQFLKKP